MLSVYSLYLLQCFSNAIENLSTYAFRVRRLRAFRVSLDILLLFWRSLSIIVCIVVVGMLAPTPQFNLASLTVQFPSYSLHFAMSEPNVSDILGTVLVLKALTGKSGRCLYPEVSTTTFRSTRE